MSLLLDALKKAAEQKAEKSKEDIPEATASDETVIVPVTEDISLLEAADNGLQNTQRKLRDETELDQTELDQTELDQTQQQTQQQTQLENTRVESEGADETSREFPDSNETQAPSLSAQMQTGEDETIVFAEEDGSDFLGEPELVSRESRDDQTEIQTQIEPHDEYPSGGDTEIDDTAAQTRLDSTQLEGDSDETAFDQTVHQTSDDPGHSGDSTVLDQTQSQEDMSLLLVEHDDTDFTSRTSLTDPKALQDQTQTIQGDDSGSDELALVDTTQHQLPDEATETKSATQTSATTPTGITQDTQATGGTFTRTDSTSTRTYAPDNYDRTLMKLPSEDESKIFAGMKSDSDVVMTPDYAKKVFRSKSAAQRLGDYKIYTGIAVVIILAIGIFGIFEFQNETSNIDANLRPLKRDPMPGIIKQGGQEQGTDLFAQAESEVDQHTIEIIESAGSETTEGEIVIESSQAEVAVIEIEPEITTVEPEPAASSASTVQTNTAQTESTEVAIVVQSEASAVELESSSSNLQISSTSRVAEIDIWLREAYAAYKSGNDELAMTRYNQVLEEDPNNRNALLARAAINVQKGNTEAAIKDYQTLLLANPKDSLAMASLISVANYSPQQSESQLKLMIRDEPSSPYLNFALANVYGAQNRWQEAQGYYFRALQSNPQEPNYAYNLAISLEHISQPGSAISYYRRALDNFENGLATFSRDVVDQRLELLAKK